MSTVGASARGRTYVRKFDYDAARKLRAEGLTYQGIADRFGVTYRAIARVCRPERTAEIERKAVAKYRAKFTCESCGKQMTHNTCRHEDGRRLCVTCRGRERRSRFSVIDGVIHAKCFTCGESRTLDQFPGDKTRYRDVRSKGVHGTCRSCQTETRRFYRQTHREEQRAYDREYKRRKRTA